ncbi:MAG: tetratricopeptide repeat protein [Cytophagales bacterium]|nr:tetratricopeptide repeat protein [Cytophagales bacterium]
MFRFIAFIVFLLGPILLHAQLEMDNLTRLLRTEKNDSIRFRLLLRLSREAEFSDYRKGREYMEAASRLADQLNADWSRGLLLLRLATMESIEGDYAQALKYDLQASKLYASLMDSANLARAYIGIGSDYRDMGEYNDAYFYLAQSYWISNNHGLRPTAKDSLSMSIAIHNLGTVFTDLGQFDIAYQHLDASEKISNLIGDIEGSAYSQDEKGELYRKKRDFEKAEKSLLLAASAAVRLKIKFLRPRVQFHLGNLYLDKGEYEKALIYFDSVKVQHAAVNNQFGLAECDLGTGKAMARLGNFPQAMKLYQKSLDTSVRLDARNLTLSCYSALANLYELTKDYEKALAFHKRHTGLRDSIFSRSAMEKLMQEQIRFETMNKDLKIEALSQLQEQQTSELERQELIQNILVVVAVLSTILLYTVYRSSRRRKRINRLLLEHQEELKQRSLELEQLNQVKDKFFSIISHDLRSPMSALAGTLNLLDQKQISQEEFAELTKALRAQFTHTRSLINNLLNWTLLQMDKLKVQKEQIRIHDSVTASFAVLRTLFPKNINFENRIDRNFVGFADPNILNLVLRNLILNAIKFTEAGGNVWVEAVETDRELIISVCDNGIGIKPEIKDLIFASASSFSTRGTANEKGTGLGLMLCKEFIEKNGGRIWMESEVGKGSSFHFTLPKQNRMADFPSALELHPN